MFEIHLGVPEMEELWKSLQKGIRTEPQQRKRKNCADEWGKPWLFFPMIPGTRGSTPMKYLP